MSTMLQQKKYTWQDLRAMPNDGRRYEAIGGELRVSPAPRYRHQVVSARLFLALGSLLVRAGRGHPLSAPTEVRFPGVGNIVQPDILFVSPDRCELITEYGVSGAPDLVVEILSPSTEDWDRGEKLKLYREGGVAEYWIADPIENFVDVWRFGRDPELERFDETLPVRLGEERLGMIDLVPVFAPG